MAEDRANQYLKATDKDSKVVAVGEKGTKKVSVNGLSPNTGHAKGDYKVAYDVDDKSALSSKASDLVDAPAFKTKPIAVTGVALDHDTLSVEPGKTAQLKATVSPANATNKGVTFSSSDETVATVDSTGKVTGVKAGSADITVKTNDGAKTAKSTVTVKAATVPVSGVSLDKTTLALDTGAKGTLKATVAPENASDKAITFASSDASIATVDAKSGEVTGVKAGNADITVTTHDGSKSAKCTVTVSDPKA